MMLLGAQLPLVLQAAPVTADAPATDRVLPPGAKANPTHPPAAEPC